MDKIAAAESIFGERVVHGYLCFLRLRVCLSMPELVRSLLLRAGKLAFYRTRKTRRYHPGRLTCKRKTLKKQRSAEEKPKV